MKKIPFNLAVILCLLLCFGCMERDLETRPELPPTPDPDPVGVPIQLYTSIQTRGLMDEFAQTEVGVACGSQPGIYTDFWPGIATENEILLTPGRFYPLDGSPVYIRGFYPLTSVSEGRLHYELTGSEDLMISCECSASQHSPFAPTSENLLEYRHLLTLLNFNLQLEGGASEWTVREVQMKGLSQAVAVSLQTGEITPGGATTSIKVYSALDTEQGLPAVGGVVAIPGYALVQPRADLTLDLVLAVDADRAHDRTYTDLPIQFDGGSGEGGSAYMVKVSVTDYSSPYARAVVVPWQVGEDGFSDITNKIE